MNNIRIIFILSILILIVKIIQITSNNIENKFNIERFRNKLTWNRPNCKYIVPKNLERIFLDNNITRSEQNPILYIPCTYDYIRKEIDHMNLDAKYYFIIDEIDDIVSKEKLWINLVKYHGIEKAKELSPMTYVLKTDRGKLMNEFDRNKLYILKNNNQRQEGLKITNSLNDILNSHEYIIVQELLQDPYLISGRKINMRFYILIVCNKSSIDVYVFNDGFMYYTKELYRKGSTEFGPNVTTGYIDRKVYEKNPLTHNDFRIYLGNIKKIVFDRIYKLLQSIIESYLDKLISVSETGKLKDKICFQIFGADIALDKNLNPKIMEINKGPDMDSKDKRDGNIKLKCLNDTLKIVGIVDNTDTDNGFIKILSYKQK
jgi:hypothetical protein